MAISLEVTPSCEITGLPLPILPKEPEEIQALINSHPHGYDLSLRPNLHHLNHPKNHPYLLDTAGGQAERHSAVQTVPYFIHNYLYHRVFAGPAVKEDEHSSFKSTVAAISGVVPRDAINFTGYDTNGNPQWERVTMTSREHRQVTAATKIAQSKPVATFFAKYASQQNILELVNSSVILDEFLDTQTTYQRKREIASNLLSSTITMSLENAQLMDKHKEWHDLGMIQGSRPLTFRRHVKRLIRMGSFTLFQDGLTTQLLGE